MVQTEDGVDMLQQDALGATRTKNHGKQTFSQVTSRQSVGAQERRDEQKLTLQPVFELLANASALKYFVAMQWDGHGRQRSRTDCMRVHDEPATRGGALRGWVIFCKFRHSNSILKMVQWFKLRTELTCCNRMP